jgi:two-component system, cell cycle response regulator
MNEPAAQQAPTILSETAAASPDKPWVLVIDDSRVIRRAIAKILNGEFNLIESEDGEAGWSQLAANERIQVVITDMEMPKLDGYELICRIRAAEEPRVCNVPVIVITGAQDDQTRERAYACGATDFVIKPLDNVQLLARTRAHARSDETTRKLQETTKSLEEQTAVDPVTELHSRRYLVQRAEQDLAYAKRHSLDLAMIRIEFDNFRGIYKQLGDEACDQLFVWLAGLMRANTRTEDTPARIRGGEFAILAPSTDRQEAAAICERVRQAVASAPFQSGATSVAVTVSVGLATLRKDGNDTADNLLERAEQNLTLAKAAGGNQMSVGHADEIPAPDETVVEAVAEVDIEPLTLEPLSLEPLALESETLDPPTLEIALHMVQTDDSGNLVPYLPDILSRIVPLLEMCNQHMDLDLEQTLQTLRERLSNMKQ